MGNFQPPGDEELEYYEDLLATNEEDGMDDQQGRITPSWMPH